MSDVTIKIPRELYHRLQEIIVGTGFRSVTEFVVYVLRDLASTHFDQKQQEQQERAGSRAAPGADPSPASGGEPTQALQGAQSAQAGLAGQAAQPALTAEEIELIRRRLKSLGYL